MVGVFYSPPKPQDLKITRKPAAASKRDQWLWTGLFSHHPWLWAQGPPSASLSLM